MGDIAGQPLADLSAGAKHWVGTGARAVRFVLYQGEVQAQRPFFAMEGTIKGRMGLPCK
jgi:hypothetical protein